MKWGDQEQAELLKSGPPIVSLYCPPNSERVIVHLEGWRALRIIGAAPVQAVIDAVESNQARAADLTSMLHSEFPADATITLGG